MEVSMPVPVGTMFIRLRSFSKCVTAPRPCALYRRKETRSSGHTRRECATHSRGDALRRIGHRQRSVTEFFLTVISPCLSCSSSLLQARWCRRLAFPLSLPRALRKYQLYRIWNDSFGFWVVPIFPQPIESAPVPSNAPPLSGLAKIIVDFMKKRIASRLWKNLDMNGLTI